MCKGPEAGISSATEFRHYIITLSIRPSRSSSFFHKSERVLVSTWVFKHLALHLSLECPPHSCWGCNKAITVLLMACLSSSMASSMRPWTFLGDLKAPGYFMDTPVTSRNIIPSLTPPPSFSFIQNKQYTYLGKCVSLDVKGLCNWGLRQKPGRNQLYQNNENGNFLLVEIC